MKNKIVGIFVCLMLVTTTIVFVPEKMNVKADPVDEEDINLDYDFIYDLTYNLSRVVYIAPLDHGIEKGREFGTKGENYTRINIIEPKMIEIFGVDNVTTEKLGNIQSTYLQGNLTHKLETLSQGLTINQGGESDDLVDFFISPRWNHTFRENYRVFDENKYNYDETLLTNNFSYEGLKIFKRPGLKNCTRLFISMIHRFIINNCDGKLFEQIITENLTLNDWTLLLSSFLQDLENECGFSFENYEEMGPGNSSLPWYDPVIAGLTDDFVVIDEEPFFNPDVLLPNLLQRFAENNPIATLPIFFTKMMMMIQIYYLSVLDHFKGMILFDHNDDTYDMMDMRDMALPILFINKTIGEVITLLIFISIKATMTQL